MTAIQPTDSALRDKIDSDKYNSILNEINAKYTEMDKFIGNLESDIQSVKDFEQDMLADKERGYDVGSSLDTLGFQKDSLQIDLNFFTHMKSVYIKKLYGDLYKYCDGIIENALAIEEIPEGFTKEQIKTRKFRNMQPYPPAMVANPKPHTLIVVPPALASQWKSAIERFAPVLCNNGEVSIFKNTNYSKIPDPDLSDKSWYMDIYDLEGSKVWITTYGMIKMSTDRLIFITIYYYIMIISDSLCIK